MICYLEHANITVLDIDRAVQFLTTAFPHFKVRGGGEGDHGDWQKKWVHLGSDETYIAIEQTTLTQQFDRDTAMQTGINHVGFVVDDVDDIQAKMAKAGYKSAQAEEHRYRKRLYVSDSDGITWEFVQYLLADPAERNDYSL